MQKLKVVTILGTRPEIIRLSRVISLLDEFTDHKLVHTGQNYDYELNDVFFKELEVRKPDYFLNINTASLGKVYGETIMKSEEVLQKENPDALLILGDTNSSVAALIAKRMKIPIYHMEAGNRCFDQNVPEEINRKVIDHIADFNLVYTEHARRNLLAEGYQARRIYLTGSPMGEVLEYYKKRYENTEVFKTLGLKKRNYFLVSAHREENVDRSEKLTNLIEILNLLQEKYQKKIIVSTHPRTRNRLEKLTGFEQNPEIHFLKPFGFFDYIALQKDALCTLSDSGTISEEAAILNFNAITIRNAMERPEAMDTANITITGIDKNTVMNAIEFLLKSPEKHDRQIPPEYNVKNTAERVLKIILGTAKLSNSWSGIEYNDL